MPTIEEILAAAEAMAAAEVEVWIPTKKGDRISGEVVEVGTITTPFGRVFTTTLDTHGRPYVEDGKEKKTENYVRVAWMGAVLDATFRRQLPQPPDLVAMHYQDDRTPKTPGLNDYKDVVTGVFNADTGRAKNPIDMSVMVPTVEQVLSADPRTSEIPPSRTPWEPFNETNEKIPDEASSVQSEPSPGTKK